MGSRQRIRASLDTKGSKTNSHPLHLQISRKDADQLGVDQDQNTFYVSFWTNTTPVSAIESGSTGVDPKVGSIFQRMYSRSQSFPEILQSESDNDVEEVEHMFTGVDVEIFACVWILKETDTPVSNVKRRDEIVLYCNQTFLSHYNVLEDYIFVMPVRGFPVSNVVIGVNSNETFQWLTNSSFCTRLLAEVCSNNVLIRAKDVFLAPYGNFLEDPNFKRSFYFDMFVLECAPIQQGILAVSTELVITYMGDAQTDRAKFQSSIEAITSPFKGRKGKKTTFKEIMISDFCRSISIGSSDNESGQSNQTGHAKKFHRKSKRTPSSSIGQFHYEVVPQQKTFKRMLWRDQKKPTFDPLYYVGMSRKMMLHHCLFDGSIVVVMPVDDAAEFDESPATPPVERLGMIKCLGKEYDKSKKLFITPLFLFNIIKKPTLFVPDRLQLKRYEGVETPQSTDSVTSSLSWNTKLPLASEVSISIIPSPNYSPRAPHDEALKQYFSVPRLVCKDDVLAVRSSDDPEFWQCTGDDTENRFPCIYFKVISIRGPKTNIPNYVLDKDHTTLIQIGTEHSYVPQMMQIYLAENLQGFWDRDNLPGLSQYVDKLENFIIPHLTSKQGSGLLKKVPPAVLVSGPVGAGKTTLIVSVGRRLGIHVFKINCHALTGESAGATEGRMKNAFNAAGLYSPCILLLQSIHAVGRERDGTTEDSRVANSFLNNIMELKNELQPYPMIVVATTHTARELTHDMQECFLHEVQIHVPTELERAEMVDCLLHTIPYSGNVSIPFIAQRTAGFVLGDMAALTSHAKREAFRRILKLCCGGRLIPTMEEEEALLSSGIMVQQQDFNKALDQLQAAHSDAIGAPKIPNVTWDDVGGLVEVKTDILDTIQLPLQYPELLAAGLRRSGVLLYGPPGTGKTLLAKAVATECSLNFLSVKGPELINMYVGQSEENIREVFRRARSATPCVIFFDELDSLAPNRGKSGDSGGVMDRVVSQLLAELDGLNKSSDVFVIGATNRPDLLDPALLRPGRFDKLLYLGISDTNEAQLKILTALTRKFKLAPGTNLETIVEKCPFNLTGADFYALCSDAMLNAVKRKIQELENDETADQRVVAGQGDFLEALKSITPSVSIAELSHYQKLRQQFDVKPTAKEDIQMQEAVQDLEKIVTEHMSDITMETQAT